MDTKAAAAAVPAAVFAAVSAAAVSAAAVSAATVLAAALRHWQRHARKRPLEETAVVEAAPRRRLVARVGLQNDLGRS